jgi:CheY-like chemotaxis protein
VSRSAESLLGIINDILDFSKIEAGRLDLESLPFELGDVMDHLASVVGLKAEEKGLEFVFAESPQLPMALVGDALRLGQVLVNLGNNAVKFTERGEVVVAVEALEVTAESALLRFSVRDTGIGLSREQQERLFQAFSQADASTSRRFGGTGLGLAISSQLVGMMGGRIEVDTSPGVGSRFHFSLRLGRQAAADSLRLAMLREPLPPARVLVVDDNASAREVLGEMTRALGLDCEEAADAWDALRAVSLAHAAGRPFDLALLDLRMPGLDGVECARQLALGPRPPGVMILTGHSREAALQRVAELAVSVRSVLTKPITPSTLFDAYAAALGQAPRIDQRQPRREVSMRGDIDQLLGRRILLVEDNDINRELATELLENAGAVVEHAHDGRAAVDLLASRPIDLVLMDCQMPVMDGYEATRELRRDPRHAALPVIAMTANAMSDEREKVLQAGMNDHIAKPIDVAEMYATIARWMPLG